MPSPFPGMDPYLEDPDLWPDVHARLIGEVQAELNGLITPHYVARVEQRVYIADEDDSARELVVPDVRVVAGNRRGTGGRATSEMPARVAVLDVIAPVEVTIRLADEVRESFLKIVDARDRSVVAVIEILSLSNKAPGSAGRRSYQEKRAEVMLSQAHWLEIDLLRAGRRMYMRESMPPFDYLVHLSRAGPGGNRLVSQVWPIPLPHPLPTVPVPLRQGDADAALDLQAVLSRAYERGAYGVDIDYAVDPVPPVTGDRAEWARSIARAAAVP